MQQPIQWRQLGESNWHDGTLVDGLDGDVAIQVAGGYLTMDRNGTTRVEPTIGAWEGHYVLRDDAPLLQITPNVVTYVLEIHET
jgi:hypothetical protein